MAAFSKLAMPYGVGDNYRVEWATSEGNQRGRRMPREPFAPSANDRIMPLPDYGIVRQRFGIVPGFREVRVVMHAGYVSDRRFARYVREYTGGQQTRIQAHHSHAYIAVEAVNPWAYQLCRSLRTGRCSREAFCNLLNVLDYMGYCRRNNVQL
jgi:hypothetical protein